MRPAAQVDEMSPEGGRGQQREQAEADPDALQIEPNCLPRMISRGVRRVVARLVQVSCSRSEVILAAAAALIGRVTRAARAGARGAKCGIDLLPATHPPPAPPDIPEVGKYDIKEVAAQKHDEEKRDRPAAQPSESASHAGEALFQSMGSSPHGGRALRASSSFRVSTAVARASTICRYRE